MNPIEILKSFKTRTILPLIGGLALFFLCFSASAQEEPPRPLQVRTIQNLSFGAFIQGNSGGTVIIDPQGSRSVTGDLIPVYMGYQYLPAIFAIDAIPGSLISIDFGSVVTLTRNNGGTLKLQIDSSLPGSPFISAKNTNNQIRIGGTLTVENKIANPSGNYFGNFSITFVQQ